MENVHLVKRHGSAIHSHTAVTFAGLAVLLLALYSVLSIASRRVTLLRRVTRFLAAPVTQVVIWVILLLYAILHHFNADFLQLARRYGQVAMACSTLSVFLSFKPAILPYTYEVVLVSTHKWIGRSGIFLAVVHGVLYFFSYMKAASHDDKPSSTTPQHHNGTAEAVVRLTARHDGGLHHHLFSLFNVFGMISLLAFVTIFFSSLGPVRRRAYSVFYALHRPLAILIYVLMIWHARPSAWLMITAGLLIMTVQVIYRFTMSHNVTIERVSRYGRNLLLVQFSPPIQAHKMKTLGSHVRISEPLSSPTVFFKSSHPYTLIGSDRLVVRETKFKLADGDAYSLFGPFDSSSFDPDLYTHFIVIAGGSGVSMLPRFASTAKNLMVWVTKNGEETSILPDIGISDCEVFITGGNDAENNEFELQEFEIDSQSDEDHSNEDQNQSLLGERRKRRGGINRHKGRPDFTSVTAPFLRSAGEDTTAKTCVITCGPETLVVSVEAWAKHHKLDVWGEVYAL